MRVHGMIKRERIVFLIDSGSTHSFLDATLVAKLGLNCTYQEGLQVVIANGSKIKSPGQCKDVKFSLGTQLIRFDFYILTLNGIDAVLGVNWLQTLGPILWDFKVNYMIFKQHGRVMELRGTDGTTPTSPPPVQLQVTTLAIQEEVTLTALLSHFAAIFQEPQGLPPARICDHRINLEPGTHPVVVRPYRLKFLLEQRIITSPQQHWLSKLMGFDFAVEYRAGKHNRVADALSRCMEDHPTIAAISMPILTLFTILDSRVVRNTHQILVHWDGLSPADSSWEDVCSFKTRFPSFALADKSFFNGGSNVMSNQQLTKKSGVNRTDVE
ncbi:hypothetical protein DKX38_011571 [Salix brachista]|uniref:Chromo domain-containing protein n=1 Tax=Salix brachista TaxID=2182728 RepID=A0A5N5LZ12_9ROSI|nr:hypothetical protein DKX38_011571 [Salix brachista]